MGHIILHIIFTFLRKKVDLRSISPSSLVWIFPIWGLGVGEGPLPHVQGYSDGGWVLSPFLLCPGGCAPCPLPPLVVFMCLWDLRSSSFQGGSDGGESEVVGFCFWMGGGAGNVLPFAGLACGVCICFGMFLFGGGGYRCPGAFFLGLGLCP